MKILAAALAALCATSAFAQHDFPGKRITLVVAAATGGGLDAVARLIAKRMQDAWGQPVIVEDQGGAEGLIATKRVAESPADGYTMLVQIPSLLLLKYTARDLDFDPAVALAPVTEIGRAPSVIAVPARLGVKTVKDLVAYCNKAATPCSWGYGQQLSYLYGRRAFALSGIRKTIGVPYKGTGPVVNDLLGGHITIGMTSIAAPLPHHQAGTLRILAVNAEQRLPQIPEVPTFHEAGLNVPPRGSWYGLFVPKGTPADVVAKIDQVLTPLAHDATAAAVVRGLGAEPVFGGSREFAAGVAEENAFLADLVKEYPLVDANK